MELIVDGSPMTVATEGQQTIGDIVGEVSKDLDVKRRVVAVQVDGQDITGNAEQHLQLTNGTRKIEVKTRLASELALEMIEELGEFHGSLDTELSRTAEEFRLGNVEKSNEMLARCVDGLQVLIRMTISVANLLQVDGAEVKAGSMPMSEATGRIAGVLEELISAQVNRDSILTADLIEYELNPLLEDWRDARENLRRMGQAA